MPDEVRQILGFVVRGLEITGASGLILGFIVATLYGLRRYFREGAEPALARYRRSLGRVVLIGLEILVAATIIKTITLDPSTKGMAFLAITVAIRTVLGWTTVLEVYGHWPWQRGRPNAAGSAAK